MGITAGRKNGNSEILLKQSLRACQAAGAEVRMINLRDFNILDCTGCTACSEGMARGKRVPCVLKNKDDKDRIMEVMLNQEGVIFSVPTYDLTPASPYLTFAHRNLAYETAFLEHIGAIEHRDRVTGLISVGGSMWDWQSMALPVMQATTFTNSFFVADMLLARQCPSPAQCLLNDDLMHRAYVLGENVVTAINTPPEDRTWLGDAGEGWCPNCHSSVLTPGHAHWDGLRWPIECAVCGAGGTLEQDASGTWRFVIAPDGLLRDRFTNEGREHHLIEIGQTHGRFYVPENRAKVNEKLAAFKELSFKGL
jgi:multimeric flavodoxin WrbA